VNLINGPATTQTAHSVWANGKVPQAEQFLQAHIAAGGKISEYLLPKPVAPTPPPMPTPPAAPVVVAPTPPPAAVAPSAPIVPAAAAPAAPIVTNATGPVVPPDAPPADLQATEPEEKKGKKGGRPANAPAVDYTPQLLAQVTRLADVLERVAKKLGA
jgi:hypothetical protein